MNKKDVTKITPSSSAVALPDYMKNAGTAGTEELRNYVVPPRLKVVQKQASDTLLSIFGIGDVIIVPNNQLIVEMPRDKNGQPEGDCEPFFFTPLFFFPEWCVWNPIELKGTKPAIRERTFDPKSEIAMKAKNPDLRTEECPELPKKDIRFVEHLNFVIDLVDHEFTGTPMILSFSRAEHASGRQLCSLIRMRKAPIYGCVFEAHVGPRSNSFGDWWGFNVVNPPAEQSPWVAKEIFETYKSIHEEFSELHKKTLIRADYEEPAEPNEDDDGKF